MCRLCFTSLYVFVRFVHTRMQATCGSSLASRCHQRSPACLIGYHDNAHRKMARRISPLDLHSPASSFPGHQGHIWLLLSTCSLLSPNITVTLPLYAMSNKIRSIVQMHSFLSDDEASKPWWLHFSVCPADWKSFPPFFYCQAVVCWVHACRTGNMLPVKYIRARNFKKRRKKTKQRKQSFLS